MSAQGFVGVDMLLVRRESFEKAGYFDESLSTYEDYDIELRLAFHFAFLFIPVPVAIYRRSMQGIYAADIVQGRIENQLCRVVGRALAMLPDRPEHLAAIREEVLARVQLKIAQELESVGELDSMRAYLLASLQKSPSLARKAWARSWIASKLCQSLRSDASLNDLEAVCLEVSKSARGYGLMERLVMRRLLGAIWWHAALVLTQKNGGRRINRRALSAVLHASVYNPFRIGTLFLKLLSGTVFG
jgi:hypothetical protein